MKKSLPRLRLRKIDLIVGILAVLFFAGLVFSILIVLNLKKVSDQQKNSSLVSSYTDNIKQKLQSIKVLNPIEGTDSNVVSMLYDLVGQDKSNLKISIIDSSDPQITSDGQITYGSSLNSVLVTVKVIVTTGGQSFSQTVNVSIPRKKISSSVTNTNVSANSYGAIADDSLDDTLAIQKSINYTSSIGGGTVYLSPGIYLINPDASINMKSSIQLDLSKGVTFKALASNNTNYEIINFSNVNNSSVIGGKIIGERSIHKGTGGEWGMGIFISGGSNIKIDGVDISDCWGDGIYIGGILSTNISIDNIISDNNRRQGLSVTNVDGLKVSNSEFKNTNGTLPQAGIDIEPNPKESAKNITITNIKSYNNKGSGIDFMGINGEVSNIQLSKSVIKSNSGVGIRVENSNNLSFDYDNISDSIFGVDIIRDASKIKFNNVNIFNNKSRGVSIVSTKQLKGIEEVTFQDSVIRNNSLESPGKSDGIRIDTYDSTGYIKNIRLINSKIIDDQQRHTQNFGLTVGDSKLVSNIFVYKNCVFSGNISGTLYSAIPINQNYAE